MSVDVELDRIEGHTRVTTVVTDVAANVGRYLRDKDDLQAVAAAWAAQLQALEDALWQMFTETDLDAAIGAQLDQLGELLVLPRGTLDDDEYRAVLRAIVRARFGSGTGDDLLAVVRLALGESATFTMREGRASVLIEPHEVIPFNAAALLDVLLLAKAAGVQLQLIEPPVAESGLFTTSTTLLAQTSSTQGLGDSTDDTYGGSLTGVLG